MLLTVTQLVKTFATEEGPLRVLQGVDLQLKEGEKVALTGESGSGKSTLLYLIGALDGFDAGDIVLEGQSLSGMNDVQRAELRRRQVGIIFQQFNLIPSLNVLDNMQFHARLAGRLDTKWVTHLADELGLAGFLRSYPENLSGGQQQRVAIGRALAVRPKLVLADEPTGNLDEETSDTVIKLMLQLVAETSAGLLLVTHSSRVADRMERRLHLSKGRLS